MPNKLRRLMIAMLSAAAFGVAPAPAMAQAPARPAVPRAGLPPQQVEAAVQKLEAQERATPPPENGILFLGSSSIARWNLSESFPGLPTINHGIGGTQVSDNLPYVDRLVTRYKPRIIVYYSGDNDIWVGASPRETADRYNALFDKIEAALPQTRIVVISIKPSLQRWEVIDQMRAANVLLKQRAAEDKHIVLIDVESKMLGADGKPRPELYVEDGLHQTPAGYRIWSDLVGPYLK